MRHTALAERLTVGPDSATLRLELPFAAKGEIEVRKVGLELIVKVGQQKRTLMLPPALGDYRPRGARFTDGALTVSFDAPRP
jgi:arsenite-transporting ATPase